MSNAIITTHYPCTNKKPARIRAKSGADKGKALFFSVHKLENLLDHKGVSSPNQEMIHREAAKEFCEEVGWKGDLISGQMGEGRFVWVFLN